MTGQGWPKKAGRVETYKSTRSRRMGLALLLLVTGLLLSGAWVAADYGTSSATPYFYLNPQVLELGPGETGDVIIHTSYVEQLGGVEVHLRWDPLLVEVVDEQVQPGNVFEGYNVYPGANQVDNAAGQLDYALALMGWYPPVSGQFTVAAVTFRAIGSGSSDVEFYGSTQMARNDGVDISHDWVDGEVRVVEATSTPTTTPTTTSTSEPTIVPPTYTPTATVTPTITATPTLTETITCWDLIKDGDLEGSNTAWQRVGGASFTDHIFHSPNHSIWLGGYNNAIERIRQVVTIPADAVSSTLTYWWLVETLESDHPNDYFYVEIRSTTGDLIASLETLTDANATATWQSSSLDVLDYSGQTIRVTFRVVTDGGDFTSFFVDDVSLDVCIKGPGPTPTSTPVAPSGLFLPLVSKRYPM